MNTCVKSILIYISGVATGVGATYFLFRKRAKFELERRLTEEMLEYKKSLSEPRVETIVFEEAELPEQEESAVVVPKLEKKIHEERNTHKTKYYTEVKKYTEGTDIFDEMKKPENTPYLVTEDDVYENKEYDTNYLTWYPDADLLAEDIGGEGIDDIDYTVGYDNLAKLSVDKPVIHVRNDYLKTDYEIQINLPR